MSVHVLLDLLARIATMILITALVPCAVQTAFAMMGLTHILVSVIKAILASTVKQK
jgi:hypothetical protein